jgi:hypothetical protein
VRSKLEGAEFHGLQITPGGLLPLDRFEECFEVALAETPAAFALDDLGQQRGAVFHGTCEDLKHVAFVVAIDEDAEVAQLIYGLVDGACALAKIVVIRGRYTEEFDALIAQLRNRVDDVGGSERNVLHTGPP